MLEMFVLLTVNVVFVRLVVLYVVFCELVLFIASAGGGIGTLDGGGVDGIKGITIIGFVGGDGGGGVVFGGTGAGIIGGGEGDGVGGEGSGVGGEGRGVGGEDTGVGGAGGSGLKKGFTYLVV